MNKKALKRLLILIILPLILAACSSNPNVGNSGQSSTVINSARTPSQAETAPETGKASCKTIEPAAVESEKSTVAAQKSQQNSQSGTSAVSPEKAREADKLYEQGFQVYMSWKLDEAIRIFDRAIETDPNCYKAYNGKGIVLCFKGDYKNGMALIDKALLMKPDFVYANFNKALAYKLQKNFDQAMVWFNKALSLDPKDTWSYFGIACIYAEKKDAEKTVYYLAKAIETDPGVKDAARKEKDLDPVRNDPEFIKLLQ